jgi:hypothetical protein
MPELRQVSRVYGQGTSARRSSRYARSAPPTSRNGAMHTRRANSAPARSTALMTLRGSRHGSDVWSAEADSVLHVYVPDAFVIRKPGGRPE